MTQSALFLVRNGEPESEIVLPEQPPEADRRAADILQSWVRKMTGATLPIALRDPGGSAAFQIDIDASRSNLTGRGADFKSVPGGFVVQANGNRIDIVSGGGKGSIYGVVDFLEKSFGCRKYAADAEVYPKLKSLTVNGDLFYADNPAVSFRCVNGDINADQDTMDWLRLDRVNELYANGYYVHTIGKLVPPETYFASHPEYYALVDGKRHREQLCFSNPDVVPIIENNLRTQMALQPDAQVWGVSQNDNQTFCHDPLCEAVMKEDISPSGPIIRLVNKIAADFPDKTIATLAYQFSRPAPKVTKPAANVMVMLCTIELNRSKPIEQDPGSQDFVQDISDWSKICKNIYLWDYTVDFSHFLMPFPNLHVLQPNIQFFVRNGASKLFEQSNASKGHEFSELKAYLLARLMWNPNADVDAVIDDFMRGYYGPAGPYLREYNFDMEQALAASGKRLDIYGPPSAHADDYLSAANVAKYNELFDKAENAVRREPGSDQRVPAAYLNRVKTARLSLDYAMLSIAAADPAGPRGFLDKKGSGFSVKPRMARLLEDFVSGCQDNGVRTLNEAGLTPKQFADACSRIIAVDIKGDLAYGKSVSADPPPSVKYSNGDLSLLTNGIRGANDFHVQWVGWEGTSFNLLLDLGSAENAHKAGLEALYEPNDWIMLPSSVSCELSTDGESFNPVGTISIGSDQRHEPLTRGFTFNWNPRPVRYLRFRVNALPGLPAWHSAAGGKPWVFVDEIDVR